MRYCVTCRVVLIIDPIDIEVVMQSMAPLLIACYEGDELVLERAISTKRQRRGRIHYPSRAIFQLCK